MASLTEEFHAASFRGVPFLVSSENKAGGKKNVIHEYPNSNDRFVEELGRLPGTFSIEAIVHGTDLINKRLRLEKALEQTGQGSLVHPIYGPLTVSALTFTVKSTQTEGGQFIFSIKFAQSKANITPAPLPPQKSTVSEKSSVVREKIGEVLEKRYKPPSTVFNTDFQVVETLDTWNDLELETDGIIDRAAETAATYSRVLRSARANVYKVVQTGLQIRTTVETIVSAALNIVSDPSDLDQVWSSLLTILSVPASFGQTAQQIERGINAVLVNEHLQLASLTNAFESKVYTDFLTDVDIDAAKSFLDESYTTQVLNAPTVIAADGLESITTDPDVRDAFADLRSTSDQVFAELEKAAFRVVDIVPGRSSMSLTSFRYYGSLDQVENIAGLNIVNPANFRGNTLKALSR